MRQVVSVAREDRRPLQRGALEQFGSWKLRADELPVRWREGREQMVVDQ